MLGWIKTTQEQRLLRAAAKGDEQAALEALVNGADAGAQDAESMTALMHALHHQSLELAKALLRTGKARPEAACNDGRTALMYAARAGVKDPALIQELVEASPIRAVDKNGWSAAHFAAQTGAEEMIEAIMKADPGALEMEEVWKRKPEDLAEAKGRKTLSERMTARREQAREQGAKAAGAKI